MAESKLEDRFDYDCRKHGLPPFVRDHKFAVAAMKRRWKFDFAWLEQKVAVEVEGLNVRQNAAGEWQLSGRHATVTGFREDCVKYNAAALLGWIVLRFVSNQVSSDYGVQATMRALSMRGWRPADDTEGK